jgi:zinc protease
MRAEPISESELTLATSYLDGVFPIRYETTSAIAAALASLVVYRLPATWYDEYRERIRAVTVDDVHRAARTYLHTDALQIVVVGHADAVREQVEALQFGPIDVVNP